MIATLTFVMCLAADPKVCRVAEPGPDLLPPAMTMQECVLFGQQIAALLREEILLIEGTEYVLRKWRCTPGQDT